MFKENQLNEIYNILKQLPLYKRRGKEEVFLGILKSKSPKWIGWNYIKYIKRDFNNIDLDFFYALYELALNYYFMRMNIRNESIDIETLKKNYDF